MQTKPKFQVGDEVVCFSPRPNCIIFSKAKIEKLGDIMHTVRTRHNVKFHRVENCLTKTEAKEKLKEFLNAN